MVNNGWVHGENAGDYVTSTITPSNAQLTLVMGSVANAAGGTNIAHPTTFTPNGPPGASIQGNPGVNSIGNLLASFTQPNLFGSTGSLSIDLTTWMQTGQVYFFGSGPGYYQCTAITDSGHATFTYKGGGTIASSSTVPAGAVISPAGPAQSGLKAFSTTGGSFSLIVTQASAAVLEVSGTLTSNATLQLPSIIGATYTVANLTTSGAGGPFTLTVQGTGGGSTLTQGKRCTGYVDSNLVWQWSGQER